MTEQDGLVGTLYEGRRRFLELVADLRPDLHRYCARMTGSVSDGEDVVQDTLARAYYALSEMQEMPVMRPWLFQIAHNRSLDHLRRYDRRMGKSIDDVPEPEAGDSADPEDLLAKKEATRAAVSRFAELVPLQRSCVILKDVLGHSTEEIAALLELSVPAVSAGIHRGRERLRVLAADDPPDETPVSTRVPSEGVARYIALFNAHDWDGVRAMLAEDVRLDLVSRAQRAGRREVSQYFSNYATRTDWHLAPMWIEGREVIGVRRQKDDAEISYFVELTLDERGGISAIKDFRYVPYIMSDVRPER